VPIFAMHREWKWCSGFGERVCRLITGESILTGEGVHWKLRATRVEKESERAQVSQKDFGWKMEIRRGRGKKGKGQLGVS